MKKIVYSVMLMVILSMLLVLPASAVQTDEDQQTALEIAALINEFRASKGLYQLVYNKTLESVAQKHTAYQVSIEESTHYGEGDSRSKDRVEASGYGGDNYIFVSEIIYHGQFATPQAALKWWENSPIHYEQMTSTQYHEFGVAVGRSDTYIYYTVNFAAIQGVTSPGVGSAPIEPTPAATSVPVTPAPRAADGSIVHIAKAGQTLKAIAEAYDVVLDTLLLYNGLNEGSTLTEGQLILVALPIPITPVVETQQAEPEPTEPPPPTESAEEPGEAQATATEPDQVSDGSGSTDSGGEQAGQGGSSLTIILVVVGVVAVAGVVGFVMMRSRQPAREDSDRVRDPDAFENRPRDQQFELLREVAEMALDAYPLDVIAIDPQRYALNAEFLVKARPGGGEGDVQEFMMRVNAPGFHSQAEISSEMEWLAALHQDTDLDVPLPIRTSSGDWVETVTLAPVGEARHCVLFRNAPGQVDALEPTPDHLVMIGAVIAKLHNHGDSFDPPGGFSRKHWDLEGLKGGMLDVPAAKAYGALTDEERRVVDQAEEVVGSAMAELGRGGQVYGLIHGDLHLETFQYRDGQLQILDFDTCGYGYFVYDLSVAVWDLFARDDFADLKSALLQGYRTERALSEAEEKLLIKFVAGRLMTQTLAWAGRRHDPQLDEAAEHAIRKHIRQLEMLLERLAS